MLRFADVSADHIVFVYADDLWLVDKAGGMARPLASPPGVESNPRFSADGRTVAFSGNYDGDADLYTVGVDGGVPFRVTHHPGGDQFADWTADGRLIFSTSAFSGQGRAPRMFTVPATGGLPDALPIPYGLNGAISADGKTLAYTPNARDGRNWKRYVGGMATDIWTFDLEAKTSRRVTTFEGTDSFPMWHGSDLYFVSDRGAEHRLNIWKSSPDGNHTQVTSFTDYDVKWPAIGPGSNGQGEIVFQNNSGLFLLDLGTGESQQVMVTIPGATETVRPKLVDVSNMLRAAGLSATGKRVCVEARGDIWTLPAEDGSPRNLTRTDGVQEKSPAWSPDGRWIAYFSDATGEYELYVTQSDGRGETKQLTTGSKGYLYNPSWSPDSNKIAYSDNTGTIYIHDIEAGAKVTVDQCELEEWGVAVNWSHDSRWLTFTNVPDGNQRSSIHLFDTSDNTLTRVTSSMFNDGQPVFDRVGDFLYFASSRSFDGIEGSDIDSNYIYTDTGVLIAVPLRKDVEYPWTPESDEESWDDEDSEDEEGEEGEDADDSEEGGSEDGAEVVDDGVSGAWKGELSIPGMDSVSVSMTLKLSGDELTGSAQTPLGAGTIKGEVDLATGDCFGDIAPNDGPAIPFEGTLKDGSANWTLQTPEGQATLTAERSGAGGGDDDDGEKGGSKEPAKVVEIDLEGFEQRALMLPLATGDLGNLAVNDKGVLMFVRDGGIKAYDIHGDEQSEQEVASSGGYQLSADGKKLLVRRANGFAIGKAGTGSSLKNVKTDGLKALINPRAEWAQVYRDAWRLFRDYFYAGNMHGVDWDAVYAQYRPMIDYCVTRSDIDYVLRETVAELNVGHAYVRGGPIERGPRVGVGMLGCDFAVENGAYKIARIVQGASWDVDARGPLSMPGVDVNEGDYLLEVDGLPLSPTIDPWAAFVGKTGMSVELTVSQSPTLDDSARRVRVKTLGSERDLRYREWIEGNRAHVFEASGGRVGYIYVPNTAVEGRRDFFRQFYGQAHLDALIIDERWNGGGWFPNREIEALDRPRTNYWGRRNGRSWASPDDSHQGPKCMLINRDAGSGGDMFPYLFRQAGLGKLIGTRTWGGLVGYSGGPQLMDGGSLAIPSFGFYEVDGSWGVEGHGVDPDIEVIDDPALMQDGADPQLDRGIAQMLEELKTGAYRAPSRPTDPDRSGMGLPVEDR